MSAPPERHSRRARDPACVLFAHLSPTHQLRPARAVSPCPAAFPCELPRNTADQGSSGKSPATWPCHTDLDRCRHPFHPPAHFPFRARGRPQFRFRHCLLTRSCPSSTGGLDPSPVGRSAAHPLPEWSPVQPADACL